MKTNRVEVYATVGITKAENRKIVRAAKKAGVRKATWMRWAMLAALAGKGGHGLQTRTLSNLRRVWSDPCRILRAGLPRNGIA